MNLEQPYCERQMEKAHGCKLLTKALLNPALRSTDRYSAPTHLLHSAALFWSPFHFLPSQVRIRFSSLSTGNHFSLKAGELAVSCKPNPLSMLTFTFHFSSDLRFSSAVSFLQRSPHKHPFWLLSLVILQAFINSSNKFFKQDHWSSLQHPSGAFINKVVGWVRDQPDIT